MPKKRSRDIERNYSRTQFVAKLRRLADALEAGEPFVIQVGGERLHIPASTRFNIEHEREGASEELEFQVLWGENASRTKAAGTGKRVASKRRSNEI